MIKTKTKKTLKKSNKINLRLPKTWLVIVFVITCFASVTVSAMSANQTYLVYKLEDSKPLSQAELEELARQKIAQKAQSTAPPDQDAPVQEKLPEPEAPQPTPEVQKPAPAENKKPSATPQTSKATPPPPPPPSATTAETASSLSYINSVRATAGKPPLTQNATMNSWALAHTNTLASQCTLYHQNLSSFLGKSIGSVNVSSIAENVGYAGTTPEVLDALKNSPGHYTNMIGDYTYVGLGVVNAGGACTGYVYTTQLFAK
jgi:uncharacterized protein YkwD